MSGQSPSTPPRRNLPWQQRRPVSSTFRKSSSSPSGLTQSQPPSGLAQSPPPPPTTQNHERSSSPIAPPRGQRLSVSSLTQNFSTPLAVPLPLPVVRHNRSSSNTKGTFAPQFIKEQQERRNSVSSLGKGIAGESSDFSGRRWVWVKDQEKAFVKGEVLEDQDGMLTIRCEDGSVC